MGLHVSNEEFIKLLVQSQLIKANRAQIISKTYHRVYNKLEKERKKKQQNSGSLRNTHPITIIDVIADMEIIREDGAVGVVDEDLMFQLIAKKWNMPYKKIDPLKLDLDQVTSVIPRSFALKHLMLPIKISDGELLVATPDPFNFEALEDIARASGYKVQSIVSSKSDIIRLITEFFGFKRSIAAAEDMFAESGIDLGNLEQYVKLHAVDELPSNDQHIVNAVNHLFTYAFDQRASDIHIEPKRDQTAIRMRIDGTLHTVYRLPKKVHSAIVSRIKNLSSLDMAEKRRPQDGRIKTEKDGIEVEIRLSTIPVAFGEKIVMRIMDPHTLFQDLEKLGFTTNDLAKYNKIVRLPYGIILVCGPTGSGKSTSLYSTLRFLSDSTINIATIEDPIEMIYDEFNQTAVNLNIGLTFSSILRSILRQDPDIIMVGEMRDQETAENAIQAALTGHLVFSTLHTNDAPSAITRMLDLGIPAFLIQAALGGVLAQRLVRKLCNYCKEPFEMTAEDLLKKELNVGKQGAVTLYESKGCLRCRHTGYFGRLAVTEVLPYTREIKEITTDKSNVELIRQTALDQGMVTMRDNAIMQMLAGVTSYQEVLRVTWDQS